MIDRDEIHTRWVKFIEKDKWMTVINEALNTIQELERQLALISAASKNVTGWDIPTAYNDENDDVGFCPYCSGWNMNHKESCKIYVLGKLVGNTPEFTPPSETKT